MEQAESMDLFNAMAEWVGDNIAFAITLAVFVILVIWQLIPKIWKPLNALFTWVGKIASHAVLNEINEVKGEIKTINERLDAADSRVDKLSNQIDAVHTDVTRIDNKVDSTELRQIRRNVLTFADELRIGLKHSKENFDFVISQADEYEEMLNATHQRNGVFDESIKYIKRVYAKCLKENKFI